MSRVFSLARFGRACRLYYRNTLYIASRMCFECAPRGTIQVLSIGWLRLGVGRARRRFHVAVLQRHGQA